MISGSGSPIALQLKYTLFPSVASTSVGSKTKCGLSVNQIINETILIINLDQSQSITKLYYKIIIHFFALEHSRCFPQAPWESIFLVNHFLNWAKGRGP